MLQNHHDIVTQDVITPSPARPQHLEILDGIARELMPAIWGLGVQCSVLRRPADLAVCERRFIDGVEQNAGRIARVLAAVHDLLLSATDGEAPRPVSVGPRARPAAGMDDAGVRLRWTGGPQEIVLTIERQARPGETRRGIDLAFGPRSARGPREREGRRRPQSRPPARRHARPLRHLAEGRVRGTCPPASGGSRLIESPLA